MAFTKINNSNKIRPSGTNCLMVYGYGEEALASIDRMRKETGIDELMPVPANWLGNTLAAIMDGSAIEKPYEREIPGPVCVFGAVSDYELNSFLDKFRESGLKKALFAVLTPTSREWRFGDLAGELARERKAMEKKR